MATQVVKNMPDQEALQGARTVMTALVTARKVYSLYSENHPINEQTVERLHSTLAGVLKDRGQMEIEVERDRLLYKGEGLYQGSAQDGDLAFSMFRDGIRRLKLLEGIQPWETKEFVRMLHRYKTLSDDAEGDLVTSLWEAQLPHVEYEVSDYDFDLDLGPSASNVDGVKPGSREAEDVGQLRDGPVNGASRSLSEEPQGAEEILKIDPALVELTEVETKTLEEMVLSEEELDPTEAVLRMLVGLLRDEADRHFFPLILEFLKDEVQDSFRTSEFQRAGGILQGLHQVRGMCEEQNRSWVLPQLDRLFAVFSGLEFIGLLQEKWSDPTCPDLDAIRDVLLLLPPASILAIGPLSVQAFSPAAKNMLTGVVTSLAARDLGPVEVLLKDSNEELCQILLGVVGGMDGDRPVQILLGLTHHESEPVRKKALRVLADRECWVPKGIFPLVEDASKPVRQMALRYLGSRRCEVAEKLFIEHLEGGSSRSGEKEYLIACYRTLGQCGSAHSIPFLRKVLLGGNPVSKAFGSAVRQCAAAALRALELEDATRVLDEAARSFYPGVRRAVCAAVADLDDPKRER